MPLVRKLKPTLSGVSLKSGCSFSLDLEKVAHHQFVDTHGFVFPVVNPYVTSYHVLVTGGYDDFLRFVEGGFGVHKEARTAQRNAVGRAVCRAVLEKCFGVSHFWHMDDALRGKLAPAIDHLDISRAPKGGDAPDYICQQNNGGNHRPIIVEAKGHRRAHGMETKVWDEWRNQFKHVLIRDQNQMIKLKGFLVATRLLEQKEFETVDPDIRIEDPFTPGEVEPGGDFSENMLQAITRGHYSTVLSCLRLNNIAKHLRQGEDRQEPFEASLPLWVCRRGSLEGQLFGGCKYPLLQPQPVNSAAQSPHRFPAGAIGEVFFGIHLNKLRDIKSVFAGEINALGSLREEFSFEEDDANNFSVLTDGTVLGTLNYFKETDEGFQF